MKQAIFRLLLIVLFASGCTYYKTMAPQKEIMHAADTIILKVNQQPAEAYDQVFQYLIENGFTVEDGNTKVMFLKTEPMYFGNAVFGSNVSLTVTVLDQDTTTIRFTGYRASREDKFRYLAKNEAAWEDYFDVITKYPHQTLYYARSQ